ncbi:hypothetical protein L6R49_20845 [Myxococcota bacterium]|nr:hypothetical protein [Myxococcota bacterium]
MRLSPWFALPLLMAFGPCRRASGPSSSEDPVSAADPVRFNADPKEEGLQIRLTEADPAAESRAVAPLAAATPLSAAETSALAGRLPAMPTSPEDARALRLREKSLPPPRTGATVAMDVPPAVEVVKPVVESGPLTVSRYAPEGEVPLAPHLSVTFSQPMVALTSVEEAAKTVPVTLTPEPPGKWRWVGAQTLLFEPDDRFPMATEYKVTVKEGTRSATGGVMAAAADFGFATPPVKITSATPFAGIVGLEPTIVLKFDQDVDIAVLVQTLKLTGRKMSVPLRLATEQEIADDPVAAIARDEAAETGHSARWVALRPTQPLLRNTPYELVLPAGTPSAEGPRRTTADQTYELRTFGPLVLEESRCGYQDNCTPDTPFELRFSNPIDAKLLSRAHVEVSPAIPGMNLAAYGDRVYVHGQKAGDTTYTLTIRPELPDSFGQTFGESKKLTFKVGPADPSLIWSYGDIVTLDPEAQPALSAVSVSQKSLKLEVRRVGPEDWAAYSLWQREQRWAERPGPLPGQVLATKDVAVTGAGGGAVESLLDLSPYLKEGRGSLIVRVVGAQRRDRWDRQELVTWVQATELGLAAFHDGEQLLVWATGLRDGRALAGVEVQLQKGGPSAVSDATGLARLKLPAEAKKAGVLTAKIGADQAILPPNNNVYWYDDYSPWQAVPGSDHLSWLTFDDRGLYRPGETARVKGWIRRVTPGPTGDVRGLGDGARAVRWILRDSVGNELQKGEVMLGRLGGFDLSLSLPPTMNLGTGYVELALVGGDLDGGAFTHPLSVQEFRRPEFEVGLSVGEGPFVLGERFLATVTASYFAGGGLPSAPAQWEARASGGSYSPPNHDGWSFGPWTPWWMFWRGGLPTGGFPETFTSLEGVTDASGGHTVSVDPHSLKPARPVSLSLQATVTDLNRQAWTKSQDITIHPSRVYVGVRAERPFVKAGETVKTELVAVGIDGERLTGVQLNARLVLLKWEQVAGEQKEIEEEVGSCAPTSGPEPVACALKVEKGGSYRLIVTAKDAEGRPTRTDMQIYVQGPDAAVDRSLAQESVQLVPDKREYAVGDVAELLIQAPFFPAEGLLTLRRDGLLREERFVMESSTHSVKVPIEEGMVPNLFVQVDLVGRAKRELEGVDPASLPTRPAYASGQVELKVPPLTRALTVEVKPRLTALEPGGATSLDLRVTDAKGLPVTDAELAVVVVDESVLALSGYQLPDPLEVFYASRGAGVTDHHQRAQVSLAETGFYGNKSPSGGDGSFGYGGLGLEGVGMGGGGASGYGAGPGAPTTTAAAPPSPAEPMAERSRGESAAMPKKMMAMDEEKRSVPDVGGVVAMRTDFSALALFAPEERTGADGRVSVDVKLPDNLTRYRVMVVAVRGDQQFGSGEGALTARKPLMVRPSAPRFLNFGDTFDLPVLVQNQTDAPMVVDLVVRAHNLGLDGQDAAAPIAGRRVTVPANDRVEVRIPAAARQVGTARAQVLVVSGGANDAATVELPVYTPATTEAFATYGVLDEGAVRQPVKAPAGVWKEVGGLEVSASSTALQSLTDAFIYLVKYPYGCAEQVASRLLSTVALKDVLAAFKAEGLPPEDELQAAMARDVERLTQLQGGDGGWGFWRSNERSWPYTSLHVTHTLVRAKAKGVAVPEDTLRRALRYVSNIERYIPDWYSEESRRAILAYAVYVRHLSGQNASDDARALVRRGGGIEGLSMEAQAWVLPALAAGKDEQSVDFILRHWANRVEETAGAAHFTTRYADGAHVILHSDRRADALILEALLNVRPNDTLIPKIVTGLQAHKKAGRWGNTQENAFVLLALDQYFRQAEAKEPNFVARVWLGDDYAGERAFKGRTTERASLLVPMEDVQTLGAGDLTLSKDGPGRLYYRLGMSYAPTDLSLEPFEAGFAVTRRYEAVDDPEDVRLEADGWHIKSGARVRVRLTMVAPSQRAHVALVDPLPAGFEAINPALATTGDLPEDPMAEAASSGPWWFWSRTWYEHQNLRDERVEAFASLVWAGVHEYSYLARATTPGAFIVPPAKAEEMYSPETFGRSGTIRVFVE